MRGTEGVEKGELMHRTCQAEVQFNTVRLREYAATGALINRVSTANKLPD